MGTDARQKKLEWLEKHNFNVETEITYVYFPEDSYSVKEELKDAGFRFEKDLYWHCESIPAGYEDKVVEINFNQIGEFTAWGEGVYRPNVKKFVLDTMCEKRPVVEYTSEWIGEEKIRFYDMPATFISANEIMTKFGLTKLVKFEDENGNKLIWWTSVNVDANPGDKILLTATVKKHDDFKGEKTTTITRAKIKAV